MKTPSLVELIDLGQTGPGSAAAQAVGMSTLRRQIMPKRVMMPAKIPYFTGVPEVPPLAPTAFEDAHMHDHCFV